MKFRFYRIAEPGGGGAGAGETADAANQPGTQGVDGAADPSKSTAGATAKPDGSGGGASATQPTPAAEPTTFEEAKALLTKERERIAEYEGKIKAKDDEAKGTIKALKEKFAGKINKIRSVKVEPDAIDGDEVKPRGNDGKYTPKDLEEIQVRANRRAANELRSAQMQDAMDEYIRAFAKDAGMNDADVDKIDSRLNAYRRLWTLADGESDADPVASAEDQVSLFEDLIRGQLAPQLMQAEYKRGYADAERIIAAKLGEQGPTGASMGAGAGDSGAGTVAVHPSANAAMASMKRLAG